MAPNRTDAANLIRELILNGELKPGQQLPPERELAARLELSRSSVREGIRELVALNILKARQGAGTFVAELTSDELFAPLDFTLRVDPSSIVHLLELRRILEPVATAMAVSRLTAEQIGQLRALCAGFAEAVRTGEKPMESLVSIDEQIHEIITESSGNPLVAAIIRSVFGVARRQRELTATVPISDEESLEELQALVEAISVRDALRARAIMTRHLSRHEEAFRRYFKGPVGGGQTDPGEDLDARPMSIK